MYNMYAKAVISGTRIITNLGAGKMRQSVEDALLAMGYTIVDEKPVLTSSIQQPEVKEEIPVSDKE